ncbi:Adaptive-response sensory-kinase SasA [Neomoorella glycerini]|uniref:histidine kinase n=1 Tax=Neomoorella glycerini TaxID=55779 RepID=A0A6I5ZVA9_9FIRM|nr:ATP-binding protein [Moorella glycerini]QGP93983.1 Adaptive-response sensory-kinase SasA [Moorella glycerini]
MQQQFLTRLRDIPLRWRLTAWYVFLLSLILAGFSAFIYFNMSLSLQRELDAVLMSQGEQVSSSLDAENGQLRLDPTLPLLPGTYIGLYDAGGKILSTNMPANPLTRLQVKSFPVNQPRTVEAQGNEWRVLLVPVKEQGQQLAWLAVARSEEEAEAPLNKLLLFILIAIPLTLVVAAGGGIFLARRALKPIDRIAAKARQISATDLSRRLDLPHGNDEVGHLVATLDEMLDRLDRAFQRQRQFTADASHELRTPLAVIRSQAEAVLNRQHSPEEYRQALAIIRDQAAWMGNLVAKLLLLARSDDRMEQLEMEPLDLGELVEGVTAEWQGIAAAKGLRLKKIIKENVVVRGDQTRLTQLLANLVDNAIKYTPAGEVVVSLERRGRQALLKVQDTGAGIPPEHLPHIFERFYRVDKARSRSEGGFGLGLSICEWIARAHGGKIEVESTVGQGTTFKVRLPAV